MENGREMAEDKAAQSAFKNTEWKARARCVLCGHKFESYQEVILDHIVPISLGGAERKENWQLTCPLCNLQKREYWGVADLSRIQVLRSVQGKFFSLTLKELMGQLGSKTNPTRYWIFERDGRKCSTPDCTGSATSEKLYITCRENSLLPTIDNLASYCIDCIRNTGLPYCE